MLIISIGSSIHVAASTPLETHAWVSGKRIGKSQHISQKFNHQFHWPRTWQVWDISPYYFWWGSKIYIYCPRKYWQETWTITNATPAPLLICAGDTITTIPSQATRSIARRGKKHLQLYSLMTGERTSIHTRAPILTVRYLPDQDYLVIMPDNKQK